MPGGISQEFSTIDNTIQGAIDGVNRQYYFGVPLARGKVSRNGLEQTLGTDCYLGMNSLIFMIASTPQPGDIITILGYLY